MAGEVTTKSCLGNSTAVLSPVTIDMAASLRIVENSRDSLESVCAVALQEP